jgi:hypothetical protein
MSEILISLCEDCSARQRKAERERWEYNAPHYPVDWEQRYESDTKYNCNANGAELRAKDLEMCKSIKIGDQISNYGGWPRIWQKVLDIAMKVEWPLNRPDVCFLITGTLGPTWEHWWSITDHESPFPAGSGKGDPK